MSYSISPIRPQSTVSTGTTSRSGLAPEPEPRRISSQFNFTPGLLLATAWAEAAQKAKFHIERENPLVSDPISMWKDRRRTENRSRFTFSWECSYGRTSSPAAQKRHRSRSFESKPGVPRGSLSFPPKVSPSFLAKSLKAPTVLDPQTEITARSLNTSKNPKLCSLPLYSLFAFSC